MATLTLAPFGLRPTSNRQGAAPTYQLTQYWIKNSYGTAIGFGDPVSRGTSSNLGYVTAYTAASTSILGVFMGVLPYFDNNTQSIVQKMGYAGTEKPPTGVDVPILVMDDQQAVMVAQVGGASNNPITISMAGGNIDMVIGTPNTLGMSTSYLDGASYNNTTSTLPLRVLGPAQQFFLGFDPTQQSPTSQPTNNYAAVVFNTSTYTQTTGI